MGLLDKLKQLFCGGPPEELLTSLKRELDEGQKQLFSEYEERRARLEFVEAIAALQSLLVRDTIESHKTFYLNLIDEMKIYLTITKTAQTTLSYCGVCGASNANAPIYLCPDCGKLLCGKHLDVHLRKHRIGDIISTGKGGADYPKK